ncbi:hypothetical protein OSTOST_24354, partial [Ostertagia ostertagi]
THTATIVPGITEGTVSFTELPAVGTTQILDDSLEAKPQRRIRSPQAVITASVPSVDPTPAVNLPDEPTEIVEHEQKPLRRARDSLGATSDTAAGPSPQPTEGPLEGQVAGVQRHARSPQESVVSPLPIDHTPTAAVNIPVQPTELVGPTAQPLRRARDSLDASLGETSESTGLHADPTMHSEVAQEGQGDLLTGTTHSPINTGEVADVVDPAQVAKVRTAELSVSKVPEGTDGTVLEGCMSTLLQHSLYITENMCVCRYFPRKTEINIASSTFVWMIGTPMLYNIWLYVRESNEAAMHFLTPRNTRRLSLL